MATTYEPIATTTLGSAANAITFSSIPSTYTDLRVVLVPFSTGVSFNVFYTLNGNTGANYSRAKMMGDGTAASSSRNSNGTYVNLISNNGFTAIPALYTVDLFSYTGSTYKTFLYTSNEEANTGNTNSSVSYGVGLWRNTSAITSMTFTTDAGNNFAIGCVATLYGIKAA